MESWLSGLRRTTGNRVWADTPPRVQIPNSPPNKNRNFDTKRIGVTVLTFWQKRRVCGTFAPGGLKRKPGQVCFPGRVFAFEGLYGLLVVLIIVKRV